MQFTSNYDFRVVIYERKLFIRLATEEGVIMKDESAILQST